MPIGEVSDFYRIFNQGKIATIITFANFKLEDEPEKDGFLEILQDHLFSIKDQKVLEEVEQRIFRCNTSKELIFTIKELDDNSNQKLVKKGIDLCIKVAKLHKEGKTFEEIRVETGLDSEQVEDIQKLL